MSLITFVAGLGGFPTLFGVGLAMGRESRHTALWPQSDGSCMAGLLGLIGGALVERRAENK